MDAAIVAEMKRDVHHVLECVSDNDLVIDAGAYIGTFSLYLKSVRPAVNIIAIEPMPGNFAILEENIGKVNGIYLEQKAIVGVQGPTILYDFGLRASACHSIYDLGITEARKIPVDGITLEDVLNKYSLSRVNFLKLDCQGAEYGIILSASKDILEKNRLYCDGGTWLNTKDGAFTWQDSS